MKAGCFRIGAFSAAALVASLCALALSGCGGGGGGGGAASATGTVLADGSLAPISGASVSVAGRAATSGADGTFTVLNLPTGDQTVRATASGYQPYSGTVNLAPVLNDVGAVYMAPVTSASNGTVTGRIIDGTGRGVAGASIQLGLVSARSRTDGTFAVYDVPPMTYSLIVTGEEDRTATMSGVTVEAGQSTDVGDVTLSSGPPGPPF